MGNVIDLSCKCIDLENELGRERFLFHLKYPARTSVSPRSSPLGTFHVSRGGSSARNVPSGERRGETDVFAGYIQNKST